MDQIISVIRRRFKRKREPESKDQNEPRKVLVVEGANEDVQSTSTTGSTSSSSQSGWDHDVFLSFRGEDTRKNFIDHLYTALVQVGIRTFRDDDKLQKGETVSTELQNAIRRSKISIVVFSKDYASSRWCLDELAEIVQRKKTVDHVLLPIFYNVDPSVVRKQAGIFAEAFARHERLHTDKKRVLRWREALSEAANCSGWDLQSLANGYESRFIKVIVEDVLCRVNPARLHVADHLVGIASHVENMEALLDVGTSDVRIVGIYGLSGIGKTTIANAVYNKICVAFEGSSFLSSIKESAEKPNGIVQLQEQLLNDILKTTLKIDNVNKGIILIEERLHHKKVLVVLDDVDDFEKLRTLVKKQWFGPGSRIIVTTKDEQLLSKLGVDKKYKVRKLSTWESRRLFSLHAFEMPNPEDDFAELSIEAVDYARGLPLALVILGSFLKRRGIAEWKSELKKLQRTPHEGLQKILRVGFDSLDRDTRDIFLDIACFFVGMDEEDVIKILNGCNFYPGIGIPILKQRSLVTIDHHKKLKMHTLIRDMGREIVHEECPKNPGKRSRLWFHEDGLNVLSNHLGSEIVEGLILNLPGHLKTEAFTNIVNLRLLQINDVDLMGSYEHLSKELKWLCWHKCPLKSLPQDFQLEKLVILDMQYSNLEQVWETEKIFNNLKVLNLSNSKSLTRSPDFSQVPQLEILILKGCTNLKDLPNFLTTPHLKSMNLEGCTSLVEIHESIGLQTELVLLNLQGCESLKNLPSSIFNLKSLKTLDLSKCFSLVKLPKQLKNIMPFMKLYMENTAIKQLPSSFLDLSKLKALSFRGCKSLEGLDLWECYKVEELLEQLGNMAALMKLYMENNAIKWKRELEFEDQNEPRKVLVVEGTNEDVQSNSITRSTSSSSQFGWDHDVFLSFRGEDTRKNFTDHLYSALKRAGIHTFRDDEGLDRGESISSELLDAIRRSRISIVVLSKGYASSRWCLDELAEIVNCKNTMGHTLLPIFFNVDPSDVRKQTKTFAEAFIRHEKRFQTDMKRVQRWREALTEAAECSGWNLESLANGYESQVIDKIVEEVLCKVNTTDLDVAIHPDTFDLCQGEQFDDNKDDKFASSSLITTMFSYADNLDPLDLNADPPDLAKEALLQCDEFLPEPFAEEGIEKQITSESQGMVFDVEMVEMKSSGEKIGVEFEASGQDKKFEIEDIGIERPETSDIDRNTFSIIQGEAHQLCLMLGGLGLTEMPKEEDWKNVKEIYLMHNELSSLPENPRCPMLLALFLQGNHKLRTIPSSFFDYMPALQILNLSRTGIRSLPESIVRLVNLKRLFLSYCHRFMRLPPKVGELKQLEVLDLEGTDIMDLPKEIKELTNLTCLEVSFCAYLSNVRRAMQSDVVVPCGIISALSQLEELNMSVNPDDKRWSACVEAIVTEVCTLQSLNTLKFYFPRVELVRLFLLNSPLWVHPSLSNFIFTVGHHVQRTMSRLPRDVEFELERWERSLKYINGVAVLEEIKKVLHYSTSFLLERHATVKKLSDFGIGNMKHLKCCVVGECNEVEVIIDATDAHEEDSEEDAHEEDDEADAHEEDSEADAHEEDDEADAHEEDSEADAHEGDGETEAHEEDSEADEEDSEVDAHEGDGQTDAHEEDSEADEEDSEANEEDSEADNHEEDDEVEAYREDGSSGIVSKTSGAKKIVLGSLEYLYIYYMKNLRRIWKGPIQPKCLSLLKSLTLRTCPQLTTIFTTCLLDNLSNLEELTVEDCPSIKTLVSCKNSAEPKTSGFLPNLKRISLHYMPGLISISNGLHIAPRLECLSFYNCPNLQRLLTEEVSSKDLKKIKGERNWWVALKWRCGCPSYLDDIFVPINI